MARSYNRIELIGNLTHNPELRSTSKGTPVCAFGLATNRSWSGDNGERQDESAFHRIVAWKTLAEQCAHLLRKGRRVFVAGRLSYRTYEQDGVQIPQAEIVLDEMILLDDKRPLSTQDGTPTRSLNTTFSADDVAEEIPF